MKIMKWALAICTCYSALRFQRPCKPKNTKTELILLNVHMDLKQYDEAIVATFKLFRYDSGLTFEYPDAVRGIYVTGHSAGGARFESLLN